MKKRFLLMLWCLFFGSGTIISVTDIPAFAASETTAAENTFSDKNPVGKTADEKAADEKMGKDIFGVNIMIYGKIYHLPAKLSDFTEDGWVLDEEDEGTMVTYELRYIHSSLSKDDKSMSVIINNITEEGDIDISECYVTGLTGKTIGPNKNSIAFLDFDLPAELIRIQKKPIL